MARESVKILVVESKNWKVELNANDAKCVDSKAIAKDGAWMGGHLNPLTYSKIASGLDSKMGSQKGQAKRPKCWSFGFS